MNDWRQKILIVSLLLFLGLALTPFGPAQGGSVEPPHLQVKIGGSVVKLGSINCSPGETCSIDWISKYVFALYTYGVGVAAILAILMIMIGGFLWLTSGGSPNRIEKARDFILSAISGLLLALFSFIILQSVNPKLIELNAVSVSTLTPIQQYGGGAIDTGSRYQGSLPTGTSQGEISTRATLAEHGISINKAPCQSPGQTNCTNVGDLEATTVGSMTALADEYGDYTITGATEAGHHTSRHGYQADIRIGENPQLDSFITSHTSTTGPFGLDPDATIYNKVPLPNGRTATFVRESPVGGTTHWHVEFY